ncbi:proteasome component ECM29 [Podospora fimiseda]|uniref:Proteasome component ECM29 n=1 Tax=Podospora fimiseda TaxID=252190 RepID=A0AAN7H1N0_9PEZI|nr:proteasome component ECM29 [Podospora fimiseda]
MADENREIELVKQVEWRILSASSDEAKLQTTLGTYLAPLMLKAASPHVQVRNKVIAACQTINKLIHSPTLVLPVTKLMKQYKENDHPLIRHFDMLYMQHSVARLDIEEKRALVPIALPNIRVGSDALVSQLLNMVLRALPAIRIPSRGTQEDGEFREKIGLSDPEDAQFMAKWLGTLLLLRSDGTGTVSGSGVSASDIQFLTLGKDTTWNTSAGGLNLVETKILAIKFLASGAFTDQERFIPALYAAASTDSRISSIGDDILKRSTASVEDKDFVQKLFNDHSKLPVPHRIRILGVLSKSEIATTFTTEILNVFKMNVTLEPEVAPAPNQTARTKAPTSGLNLERTKLYRALFEFINWVARIGPGKSDFSLIARPLVDLLRDYIQSQGWPKAERQSLDDNTLRSRAYETIGILAKGTSMSGNDSISLAAWLFRSLSEDTTPDVVVYIEGALSCMTSLFQPPHDFNVNIQLQSILLTYMTLQEEDDANVVRSARQVATKWANQCLPFADVHARWIDILAIAGRRDERSDTIEEGQKGLDPWTYYANDDKWTSLPSWNEMVKVFFREPITYRNSSQWIWNRRAQLADSGQTVFLNFPDEVRRCFPVAVDYCRKVLFLTALDNFKVEAGWERQLETTINSDLASRKAIRAYLAQFTRYDSDLAYLLSASFEGMIQEDADLTERCARAFVDIASFAPKAVLQRLALRWADVFSLITSNKKELRVLGAKAFGILAAHPSNSAKSIAAARSKLIDLTQNLKTAVGSDLNAVEGAFLALAHLESRLVYYSTESNTNSDLDITNVFPSLDSISSFPTSTQETLFEAYTQLWTAGVPTAVVREDAKGKSADSIFKLYADPLVVYAKKGNEKAITALGRLCLSFPEAEDDGANDTLGQVLEKLYSLYEIRQAEVHFSVGEAIAAGVARWDAEVVQLTIDVQVGNGSFQLPRRSSLVTTVLEKLLTDAKNTKPSLLKASGIWLFCIIQHCSNLEEVQARLRHCQAAFMRLLSARDELVQETASRGLALVYEKGDEGLKKELVRDLVAGFTGSGPQLKVDEETELFEAGALPTGDGKSITSYKDIVSLANELGDPSLVYKFMSLATNAATWSIRSAFGRFGLSNILSESEIDPKLYPKLYRYRFDPNPSVQRSMEDIWKALVKDSNAVLEAHFDAIITDLLKCIIGGEWRVREASCHAIADLISGRPFPKYEKYYTEIWKNALKVLDDVKSTVREAAFGLCMSLSKTLVRQLEESGSTAAARAMVKEALPFMLSVNGIESSAKEVQLFSIVTVMDIAKNGGNSLKPYIPTMIPRLLELLSSIEPEIINYHYQRVGADNRDVIDKARSAAVNMSPISEAVENCLRNVDAEVMNELTPKLIETIKSALGMPTKVGCARVLTTLATRHTLAFEPHSATFLALMQKQALDKNDEVSQGYARAAAYLIRFAPDKAKQQFIDHFVNLYLSSENDTRRQKVADVVLSISKISPDHFNALEGQLLPFAFLGKHDTDNYVSTCFGEVWSSHAGSSFTVIKYLAEIVSLLDKTFASSQWALRHGGALTSASAASAITDASKITGKANPDHVKLLWPVYDKALLLKTFDGKEKLLEPFPLFVERSEDLWKTDTKFSDALKKVAVREAKRNNDEYRPHAFQCLWKFAAARTDLDMLHDIANIVGQCLTVEKDDPDAMDIDEPKGKKPRRAGLDLKTLTTWAAVEAIAKGYNRVKMTENPNKTLREVVFALEANGNSKGINVEAPYLVRPEFDTVRRTFWYDCVKEVFDDVAKKLKDAGKTKYESADDFEVVKWFLATLDIKSDNPGVESQRLARAGAVGSVVKLAVASSEYPGQIAAQLKALAEAVLEGERSLDVQKAWREVLGEL